MVTVKFYKTVSGRDRLVKTQHFDTMEDALASVDEWEGRTPDNYAVFS